MQSDSFDLRQVFDLHPEVYFRCYNVNINFEELERIFLPIKLGEEEFSQKHLDVLESESCFYNEYRMPRLDSKEINTIKRALSLLKPKDKATIEKIDNVIGNIEIVSFILRLINPNSYGILDPMVENLLNVRGNTRIEKYMNFLEDLDILAEHSQFERIADIQIALWALAKIVNSPTLKYEPQFCDIYKAYEEHPTLIEKAAAKNSLQLFKKQDNLSKAELYLESDLVMAGFWAGKELEILIKDLCKKYGIKTCERTIKVDFRYLSMLELGSMLLQNKIINRTEYEDITRWWPVRNKSIHPKDIKISKDEVDEMISGVRRFRERHFPKQYIQKTHNSYLANLSH